MSSRIVSYESEYDEDGLRIELWSPNSTRHPFYPGRRRAGPFPYSPNPFCDGHLGPFDPTRSPQYFDPASPHFAFILRSGDGTFPVEAEECVPLWAVWESAPRPHRDGRVQPEYWTALSERASLLRKQADTLTHQAECREWQGFIEAYPIHPEIRDFDPLPDHLTFEDAIGLVVPIQRQVAYLAAWVRMGEALLEFSPRIGNSVEEAVCPRANDIFMGTWVNGMPEYMVSWMAAAGVPIFIAHEVQGLIDSPVRDKSSLFVNIPLGGTELATALVLDRWNGLLNDSPGMSVVGSWDTGVDFPAATPKDQLLRWRSYSGATKSNFPGEHWSLPAVQASALSSHDSAARIVYVTPPPIQSAAAKGVWVNFVESTDDDGRLVFYLVGKGNKGVYEDASHTYYDRVKKRVLHCVGKLIIPPTVVHDANIFGFPCPDTFFYTDGYFKTKVAGSSWLYPDRDPLQRDIGRIAQPPDPERLTSIQSTDPVPMTRENTPEVEGSMYAVGIQVSQTIDSPAASTTSLPITSEPPQPPSATTFSVYTDDPPTSPIPSPTPTNPVVPRTQSVVDTFTRTSRKRKFRAEHQTRVTTVPSRIPGQLPLRNVDTSTPYILAAGIGHHSLADFRGWLARSVPMLRITVVRKIYSTVGTAVFVIKFREREEAASFIDKYHMRIIEHDRLALSFVRHGDYLATPRTFILDEWNIGRDPSLDPNGSIATQPTPSLLSRLQVPLEHRLSDVQSTEDMDSPAVIPTWPEVEEQRKRTRRGGGRRRFAQALLGTPSGR